MERDTTNDPASGNINPKEDLIISLTQLLNVDYKTSKSTIEKLEIIKECKKQMKKEK